MASARPRKPRPVSGGGAAGGTGGGSGGAAPAGVLAMLDDEPVALALIGKGDPTVIAPVVVSFLNSTPMVLWAKKELGLEFVRREW